jgi:hypothetical protein
MRNRLYYVIISILLLSIVSLLSFLSVTPHQAAAYSTAPEIMGQANFAKLPISEDGPICQPEAIRITFEDGQQSACFVRNAHVQLPRVSHLFAGMYAGFLQGEEGEIVHFCPWKLYSASLSLVVQVTITGTRCHP